MNINYEALCYALGHTMVLLPVVLFLVSALIIFMRWLSICVCMYIGYMFNPSMLNKKIKNRLFWRLRLFFLVTKRIKLLEYINVQNVNYIRFNIDLEVSAPFAWLRLR